MTDFPSDARNDLCSKEKLYNMLLIIIRSLLAKRQISMSERQPPSDSFLLSHSKKAKPSKIITEMVDKPIPVHYYLNHAKTGSIGLN